MFSNLLCLCSASSIVKPSPTISEPYMPQLCVALTPAAFHTSAELVLFLLSDFHISHTRGMTLSCSYPPAKVTLLLTDCPLLLPLRLPYMAQTIVGLTSQVFQCASAIFVSAHCSRLGVVKSDSLRQETGSK
eukprot:GHVQ01000895.1.p1 GENE.GHVQ01000895.1~~GHVQ01000895.1.p1  ORF type:complete len:132 (+),score=14.27 GHVQ01000895.1:190-585(+)